jgi:hypothetical protein
MSSLRHPHDRARQHGAVLEPVDRRQLERAGWRTMLDYRENHMRGRDGRLIRIEPVWIAEAERYEGKVIAASAEGPTAAQAWSNLVDAISQARVRTTGQVRLAAVRS